jgi:hypothetical protein
MKTSTADFCPRASQKPSKTIERRVGAEVCPVPSCRPPESNALFPFESVELHWRSSWFRPIRSARRRPR